MMNRYVWITVCLLAATLRLGAQTTGEDGEDRCRQWVDSVFSTLTSGEKMGQLAILSLPAQADGANKKQMRNLMRKYKVGGLMFKNGTAEEQAILTNLACKEVSVPLLITTGGERLSDCLSGVTVFPQKAALRCISDSALLRAYRQEAAREYKELGMVFDPSWKEADGDPVAKAVMVLRADEPGVLADSLASGRLTEEEVERRCRQVLAYKYRMGLETQVPQLRVSGISYRICTEEARQLASELRQASVTVLHNYFNLLPLAPVEGGLAVLEIGAEDGNSVLVEALRERTAAVLFRLSPMAGEAECREVMRQLQPYKRVVVSVMGGDHFFLGGDVRDFLSDWEWQVPVTYLFFTSYRYALLSLEEAVTKAGAVVLAHSDEPDLQRYMVGLLFSEASASGRLSASVGRTFPAGAGCDLVAGTKPVEQMPEDWGMRSYILQQVDGLARKGLEAGAYPGCRILVLKDGKAVYDKGFGTHSDKDTTAVRPTDLFDLSSVTMSAATVLAVMKLYDERKLGLDEKVSKYVPRLRGGGMADITVRDLLLHESGLPPHLRFYIEAIDPNSVHGPYAQSWEDQWHKTRISEHSYFSSDFKFKKGMVSPRKTAEHTLHMAEGMWMNQSFKNSVLQQIAKSDRESRRYIYSQVGFILLQQVVEAVSGLPLDLYVAKEFYAPMGLLRTMFLPLNKYPKEEIMPTATNDYLRRQDLCGYVHNEAAACLGGVAGNAGLFSTAEELARIYQMLLDGGEWRGQRYLSEETCRLFTTETSQRSRRGLGFDRPDTSIPMRSPCTALAPASVFGQNGSSGTAVWADPQNRLVYVFLSNRLCPNAWSTLLADMKIIKEIQGLIYQSLVEDKGTNGI